MIYFVAVGEKIKRAQKVHSSLATKDPETIRCTISQVDLTDEEKADALFIKAQQIIVLEEAKQGN